MLRVSLRTLDTLLTKGSLRRIRVGGKTCVRVDEVEKIMGGGHGQTQAG